MNLIAPSGREVFGIPRTCEYNIIAAVMQFLRQNLLHKEFYCPLARGAIGFLGGIEKSMRNLEPQRSQLHTLRATEIVHRTTEFQKKDLNRTDNTDTA